MGKGMWSVMVVVVVVDDEVMVGVVEIVGIGVDANRTGDWSVEVKAGSDNCARSLEGSANFRRSPASWSWLDALRPVGLSLRWAVRVSSPWVIWSLNDRGIGWLVLGEPGLPVCLVAAPFFPLSFHRKRRAGVLGKTLP